MDLSLFFRNFNYRHYCAGDENKRLSLNNPVENEDVEDECAVHSFIHSFRIADFHSLMKRNGACSIAVYILCIHFAESAQLFHHRLNSQRCVSILNATKYGESANALPQNLTVSLFLFEERKTQKPQTFFSTPLTSQHNESMFIVFVFLGCCRCALLPVSLFLPFCYWLRWLLCLYSWHMAICR